MPQLHNLDEVRRILQRDRAWALYALGDLAPEHWPFARWHADAHGQAVLLLYTAFRPVVLLTVGPPEAVAELLPEVADEPELILHIRPEVVPLLRRHYNRIQEQSMWRMVLEPGGFTPAGAEATRLTAADLPALERLYADGNPTGEQPHFFLPSMVEAGVFFGVYEGPDLIAAAGTHLVVPAEGVAAVGSIYTRRDRRRKGLGEQTTAAVVAELLRRNLETIGLNVAQANPGAAGVYERLGFRRYCPFVEGRAWRS
jgi:ribosomal protein S18 acetylase RimI-like enzyme